MCVPVYVYTNSINFSCLFLIMKRAELHSLTPFFELLRYLPTKEIAQHIFMENPYPFLFADKTKQHFVCLFGVRRKTQYVRSGNQDEE